MKFISFTTPDGKATWGYAMENGVVDLGRVAPDLLTAIAQNRLPANEDKAAPDYPFDKIAFLPLIPNPGKIICVGLNYRTHILETGRPLPEKPALFVRFPNSQTAHGQPIVRPDISERLDFEGELAFIISKTARKVAEKDAMDYVAGFSCYNDGSVRDWQHHTHQFTPGKNFLSTGSFGPWMVPAKEFNRMGDGALVTRLNGQEMQRTMLNDMVFTVPFMVAYCSTFTQLEPGDVIITGTPGGVGAFRKPPVWMKPGDTVEVEIDGIGILRNPIAQEI